MGIPGVNAWVIDIIVIGGLAWTKHIERYEDHDASRAMGPSKEPWAQPLQRPMLNALLNLYEISIPSKLRGSSCFPIEKLLQYETVNLSHKGLQGNSENIT